MSARRLPSWAWVTGLLCAALVVVVGLAVRAEPMPGGRTDAGPAGSASKKPQQRPEDAKPKVPAVPAASGEGHRVVYSLEQRRVWLVEARDKVSRTFAVWPGSVHPPVGAHKVSSRLPSGTGTDGVKVANIIYFAKSSGLTVAFSNAVDGARPETDLGVQTAAVRQKVADGAAMWKFAPVGTIVNVVA
ncbi:hypothetical protein [Streptomyces uncialis]|uniref:hypothetical protein n=1 Tax=Streptomyces uncialis TaxID=1048205 RepID=UPI000ABB9AFD|nr:hypothetical protein [Streptomyces uncialis]